MEKDDAVVTWCIVIGAVAILSIFYGIIKWLTG